MTGHLSKQIPGFLSSSIILAQITDPVIAIDFESRVLFWNKGAEQLYELSQQEILGHEISRAYQSEWLHGEDEQAVLEEIRKTGKRSGENVHLLHDGRKLFIAYDAYVLRGDNEEPIGYVSILRDVSNDRKPELDGIAAANRKVSVLFEDRPSRDFLGKAVPF